MPPDFQYTVIEYSKRLIYFSGLRRIRSFEKRSEIFLGPDMFSDTTTPILRIVFRCKRRRSRMPDRN
ncbi:hypothetical protein LEP1GSC163_1172 [Leptospira santarosai str. CBC379]|nr:hypothetical protein LEP1GSC163_1172 [Leptospira santarosai str. CBC379]